MEGKILNDYIFVYKLLGSEQIVGKLLRIDAANRK
jgi:hypothetical protein